MCGGTVRIGVTTPCSTRPSVRRWHRLYLRPLPHQHGSLACGNSSGGLAKVYISSQDTSGFADRKVGDASRTLPGRATSPAALLGRRARRSVRQRGWQGPAGADGGAAGGDDDEHQHHLDDHPGRNRRHRPRHAQRTRRRAGVHAPGAVARRRRHRRPFHVRRREPLARPVVVHAATGQPSSSPSSSPTTTPATSSTGPSPASHRPSPRWVRAPRSPGAIEGVTGFNTPRMGRPLPTGSGRDAHLPLHALRPRPADRASRRLHRRRADQRGRVDRDRGRRGHRHVHPGSLTSGPSKSAFWRPVRPIC